MSPAVIFGAILMIVGVLVAGDAKSFGMTTPSAGIAVSGVGFFIAVFGYFGATSETNRGSANRRVRDHSV